MVSRRRTTKMAVVVDMKKKRIRPLDLLFAGNVPGQEKDLYTPPLPRFHLDPPAFLVLLLVVVPLHLDFEDNALLFLGVLVETHDACNITL